MNMAGYYRYPTIAGDTVVFVSEDDLWTVDRRGGTARRLTSGWGASSRPWFSPDGQRIAFVGREEGDNEIYIMPAQGGEVRRLTYLAGNSVVAGWDPDGFVVFSTNAGRPFRNWNTLFRISPEGGQPESLPYGIASSVAFGPDGGIVIGRNTADPARWKRYRGGTRGVLWIRRGHGEPFRLFDSLNGNLASPLWIGDRIYFISDHEGIGNLYSIALDGQDLTRHTDHEEFYARNASSDGIRIVYHAGADIYIFEPGQPGPTRISIEYHSQRTQRENKFITAEKYLTEAVPGTTGEKVLITTRGKPFLLGNFEGPVTQLGVLDGVRYRLNQWLPDGTGIVSISDETGEEAVELVSINPSDARIRISGEIGRPLEMAVSPDGQFAALTNQRHELWLVDLKASTCRILDSTDQGPLQGLDWSPDSQWIAYGYATSPKTSAIKLYHLPANEGHLITRPLLNDINPVFDPDGKYLYFLSYRTFDPVYDNLKFDLGFPNGVRPYLIPLRKDTTSPFIPCPKHLTGEPEKPASSDDSPKSSKDSMVIHLDGIENRILAFPVPEGRYLQLGAQSGRVFWTTVPLEGSLNHSFYPGEPTAKATLTGFDLNSRKADIIAQHVTSFFLSPDKKSMIIRSGNSLRLVRAGDKVDDKKDKPGRESGILDLGRISCRINQLSEWTQMQREAWRLMRDNFWTANLSEVDWEAVYIRFQGLLPRVSTRSEFSDLMWEMQGETGTSHAYEMGGDYRSEPQNRIGLLAADLVWNSRESGYEITHIVSGDSWQPSQDSPLRSPGINVSEGDLIMSVDGQPLGPDLPPAAWLINKSRREVQLTVRSRDQEEIRTVVVQPLESELGARYREWVQSNHRIVTEATHGRIGYLHIPDMGPRGYAEFYRSYLTESQKEGLIVDVRFNGGGHVSQLILENLNRKRIGYDIPRNGPPEPYPGDSVIGPMIALTNEYAGSDGDIFSHSFKLYGLGPLIGKRTWGGVIGISVRHALVDGSVTTQPEFSFWFMDVGWGVENYGTDPNIVVENTPEDYANGVDTQLNRAIQEALTLLEVKPPKIPIFDRQPTRAIPKLPPRR